MTPIRIIAAALGAALAATPAAAQDTKVAIGISGWTGFAPLTLAKEAGIFAKNGLDVTIKKIPQASRHLAIASGDIQCAATTVETWVVVERQRRRHHADLPARQVLRRRRHGGAQRHRLDQGPQGQDGRGLGARHRALFHAGLVPEEERPVGEGRDRRQHGAGPGGAGLHRRPERRGHDLRALSVGGARQARSRQDHRHHARLSDDHGHLRLHAEVPRRQRSGREGAGQELFRGARHDQAGPKPRPTRSWAPT